MPGTERTDWIDEPAQIPEGWEIDGPPIHVDVDDTDMLAQRQYEWMVVLRLIGGIVSCAAVRREIAPDHYVTVGFAFKWDSFAPTERLETRRRKPRHEQDPAVEADPVTEAVVDDDTDLYDGDPGDRERDPGDVLAGSA